MDFAENPQPVPDIDYDHLRAFLGDDISIYKEVFRLFRNQTETWAKLFDVRAQDEQWQSVMHSLKGSARAVGANTLASLCEAGEILVGEKADLARREEILADIEFNIARVNIEIGRWEYRQTLASMRS